MYHSAEYLPPVDKRLAFRRQLYVLPLATGLPGTYIFLRYTTRRLRAIF